MAGGSGSPLEDAFPGYRVVREISRGGQGIVYQAVQERTKRKVAIKVLLDRSADSEAAQRRFQREIELAANLKHANIVSVYEAATTADGRPFCAMEYVRGQSLDTFVRERKLGINDTLELFGKVCEAVQYAHLRGVMHRDIKPLNILVDDSGRPHITDFGLAKLSTGPAETLVSLTGQVVGTLPYMSPEQVRANPDEIDARTDVYSLGVVLFQLLTGTFPYPVQAPMAEVFRNITEVGAQLPRRAWRSGSGVGSVTGEAASTCPITDDAQAICLKAIEKSADDRYQSAGDLAHDVRQTLEGAPIAARTVSVVYLLRVWLRQNVKSTFWILAIGVFCGTVSALAMDLLTIRLLVAKSADAFAKFPSETPPLFARHWNLPAWSDLVVIPVFFLGLVSMGLLVNLTVRPKGKSSDAAAGLGTGVVAGLCAYAFGIGWAAVLAMSPAVVIGRLAMDYESGETAARMAMGEQVVKKSYKSKPTDPVTYYTLDDLWAHRDLKDTPVAERPNLLFPKVVATLSAGVQTGILLGLAISLVGGAFIGVVETMIAGRLRRRCSGVVHTIGRYCEVTCGAMGFVVALVFLVDTPAASAPRFPWALIVFYAFVAIVATGGFAHGTGFFLRGALYSTFLGVVAGAISEPKAPVVGMSFIGLGVLMFVIYIFRRRRVAELRAAERAGRPACPNCGYDLRGQQINKCPECGREVSSGFLDVSTVQV